MRRGKPSPAPRVKEMDLLVIILIVALLVWLVCQFAPAPAWIGKGALVVWLVVATLLLAGARITF